MSSHQEEIIIRFYTAFQNRDYLINDAILLS